MNRLVDAIKSLFGQEKLVSPIPDGYVVPTPTPRPPTPTPTQAPNFGTMTTIENRTAPTFDKYQIPRAIAYGIASAEGGRIGSNNIYNIGAYDSNPQAAVHYDSPEQAATAAAKLFNGTFTRVDGSIDDRYAPAFEKRDDPQAMLRAIEDLGYAGPPETWKERSASTGGAGTIYDKWSDFVMDTPGWKKWSK